MNSKNKSESHPDQLAVIKQIEEAETELTRQVTRARQAVEDRLLQAQKDAFTRIQMEQEATRQARREMVRTEMETAEFNATQELKDAETKAQNYFAKGTLFVSNAVTYVLKNIFGEEDQGVNG